MRRWLYIFLFVFVLSDLYGGDIGLILRTEDNSGVNSILSNEEYNILSRRRRGKRIKRWKRNLRAKREKRKRKKARRKLMRGKYQNYIMRQTKKKHKKSHRRYKRGSSVKGPINSRL